MIKKAGAEFKVGLFVIIALAILVGLVVRAGDFYMKPGYTLHLFFNAINGLEVGSPVRLAGVNVGEVKGIRVVRDSNGHTQVQIDALINQAVYIEEDARMRIDSLGFLGEKYIEILPGTKVDKLLANGGMLTGEAPKGMDAMVDAGGRLVQSLQTVADHMNDIVGDPQFKESAKSTFVDADKAAKNFVQISEDLKDAAASAKIVLGRMRDGEGTVGRLLKDDKIAKDLEAFVEDIKAHPWKLLKRG